MTLAPGARLGPYEILSPLDLPGLGEVYRARDHDEKRDVAFRVIRTDFGANPERLHRFQQDVNAALNLTHANILTVYTVGTDGEAAYVVSEPIEGRTLRQVLRGGALPVGTVIKYAAQIAQALAAAHHKGVIHRDLKPENILITPGERVKVTGFGLASVTQNESALVGLRGASDSIVLGSPGYISPEQARGQTPDQRSDMFIFGAIVYEMLSGNRAFSGATPVETMTAVLREDPPPLSVQDVPPVVHRIVDLSLKKNPGARLPAEDAVAGLQGFWSQPVAAPESMPVPATPSRRGRGIWIAAAVIALGVMGIWLLRGSDSGPTQDAATSAVARPETTTSTEAPTTIPPVSAPVVQPEIAPPVARPTPPPPAPRPGAATASAARPAPTPRPTPPAASTPRTPVAPERSATLPRVPSPPARPADGGRRESQLVWFDLEGKEIGRIGKPADYGDISLSPDGKRVAVSLREAGSATADIWVFDVGSGTGARLTTDPADEIAPLWSEDGARILFSSSAKGSYDIYERSASASGEQVVLVEAPGDQIAYGWSPNGRYLIYQTNQPKVVAGGNLDLWARPLPTGRAFAYLRTVHAASRATAAPEGDWISYTSLENGREDVYLAQFPRYKGRRRISPRGGSWSRWGPRGNELFYLGADNRLMVVPLMRDGQNLETGTARPLFEARAKTNRGFAYDVSRDGRVLINLVEE